MEKIKISTLEFLSELKQNNYREWFIANKVSYDDARKNYEMFVQNLIERITEFDPILKGLEVKSCIYRINRDIRFSNDKSPYKSHFGAFIVRGGKKNGDRLAGYYIHIEPGKSILAGGAYMPPAPWLNAIREKIDESGSVLQKILDNKTFTRFYKQLEGEKLIRVPKGYSATHPYGELLKYKSYLAFSETDDEFVTSDKFFDYAIEAFKAVKPLNDFLNDY